MMTRRELLRLAIFLPAGAWLSRFQTLAEPERGKIRITDIRAMKLSRANCLIRIETDAGISGYGEAGTNGPMARARIDVMKQLLIGKDPLAIEVHFHNLTTLMHAWMAHIPTISGIDIALWDLAGKILDRPVCVLLGGPFREAIPLYSHGVNLDMLDKASCHEWAQRVRSAPEGFSAYKISFDSYIGIAAARYANTLTPAQVRTVFRAYSNVREAVGTDIDIAVHCHNELDTPSAIAIAKAVEPLEPLFYEDPLNVPFSEAWISLKRSSRIPLLTGEKLEMLSGFKPFIDHQAVDIIHPDLAFAGGITGVKKIADYASLTRMPVALHNVGSLILTMASAHMGASVQNFYRSESPLGWPDRIAEKMAATHPPIVKNGVLQVPTGAGLGLDINPDFLKEYLEPGEPFWG
jgi:L-alanine-DL-glutamate epimerase-like enolase superfamily enzyme